MRMMRSILASGALASAAIAGPADSLGVVVASVKEVCRDPATEGSHWSVNASGSGEIGVKVLKLPSAKGDLHFSREEWKGVQGVIASARAGNNASYRACVRDLTPKFLAKLP